MGRPQGHRGRFLGPGRGYGCSRGVDCVAPSIRARRAFSFAGDNQVHSRTRRVVIEGRTS